MSDGQQWSGSQLVGFSAGELIGEYNTVPPVTMPTGIDLSATINIIKNESLSPSHASSFQ